MAWWQPDAAIQAARRRELRLMPPTAVCLAELGACGQVDSALRADRDLRPVSPGVVEAGDTLWLTAHAGRGVPPVSAAGSSAAGRTPPPRRPRAR